MSRFSGSLRVLRWRETGSRAMVSQPRRPDMTKRFAWTVAVILCFMGPSGAAAQGRPAPIPRDTNLTHVLRLADGSTLVGKLLSRDSLVVRFETNGGVLVLPLESVKELRTALETDIHGNEYWFPDANQTRLFFAPTGRMLKKGEAYYSNTYLLLQNFVGAPSDKFTFGGGFSIVPSDDFFNNNIYYLTPKLGVYNTPKTNVAIGALTGFIPTDNGHGFGILYGVATHGGPDASITGGLGYGYAEGRMADRPLFMIGGAKRISRRVSLLSENYAMWVRENDFQCTPSSGCTSTYRNNFQSVVSYGLRFMGEKLSTDLALWNYANDPIFPGIPYLAFAVKF